MGFMDKVKGMLGQHGDKVQQGLDKAAKAADSRTKGKYSSQISSGTQKAKDAAQRLADEGRGQGGQGGQSGSGGGPTGGGPTGGGSGSGPTGGGSGTGGTGH
ncbi:antitoxin [Streptomyces tubbatahanensis]|uniref:Antitoxin n=1 Tax=Streptomyces tubbatahanensis TaxID=2923272 RepID=A0ABY3XY57_9ACTN|nr:antitoxin [Streptomyces tubbatahanensis]UNS99377.1 antitoxin [Streptomyces tubbatahanensis]